MPIGSKQRFGVSEHFVVGRPTHGEAHDGAVFIRLLPETEADLRGERFHAIVIQNEEKLIGLPRQIKGIPLRAEDRLQTRGALLGVTADADPQATSFTLTLADGTTRTLDERAK